MNDLIRPLSATSVTENAAENAVERVIVFVLSSDLLSF
jgi:hypothetical protein